MRRFSRIGLTRHFPEGPLSASFQHWAESRRSYPSELRQRLEVARVRRSLPLFDKGCIFLRHRKGAPNIGGADRGKARLYFSQIPAVQNVPIGGVIGCPFT